MEAKTYLDTHVVVWLHDGEIDKLSKRACDIINTGMLHVSEFVRLELQYLYEINRLTEQPDAIIEYLSAEIGLRLCQENVHAIITESFSFDWTRDPFDRLITANAAINNSTLVTKDEKIRYKYPYAVF